MDALEDHPEIKFILGLHESIVIGIAEGYAIASNKTGVAFLHTAPGLASSMGGLMNAYGAGAPLVLLVGQQDNRLLLGEPCLTADLVKMAEPLVKWGADVSLVDNIPLAFHRAFKTAQDIPTGPVLVGIPKNLMNETLDLEYRPHSCYSARSRPDPDDVNRAVEVLKTAQAPLMIVGSGVAKHEAVSEVVALAESIGAGVYQTWTTDMNFPTSHPIYVGNLRLNNPVVRAKLKSADVLVSIGNPVFRLVNVPDEPLLSPEAKIVQIDSDIWEMGKNMTVAAGVLGDIKVSVAEINNALQNNLSPQAHQSVKERSYKIAEEKKALKAALLEKALTEKGTVPISASRVMHELRNCIKPGTILIDDSWSNTEVLNNCIDFDEPGSYHRIREYRHGGGSIGWGITVSLGIKLACPDRIVVAVIGDGSAIFYFQSLWTAAHYNIPVVFIILANASYNTLKKVKLAYLGKQNKERVLGLDINNPRINFCELAQAMGVQGQRIEKPDDIGAALSSAMMSGKPALVEIIIEDTV
jgi:benzoylformate decarboxylase